MSGLIGSLSISLRALMAQQASVQTSSENIANVNTPGYARRRVVLQEDVRCSIGNTVGGGVEIQSVQSLRDRVLELRILAEQQSQSKYETVVNSMESIELLFSNPDGSIGTKLQDFFSSIQRLSATPADVSLRSQVLMSAENLAASFRTASAESTTAQRHIETSIEASINEVNRLTAEIAKLNVQVAADRKLGLDAGGLDDRLGVLLRDLATLVNFSTIDDPNGLTLTTAGGRALVVAGESFKLQSSSGLSGRSVIYSADSADITSDIRGGTIGGLLKVHNDELPALESHLDDLAWEFCDQINEVHKGGFDLNGDAGEDLFVPGALVKGAAAGMRVAITDPAKVAGSADHFGGDNTNLLKLLDVANSKLAGGQSPVQAYAAIVYTLGSSIQDATQQAGTSELMLEQLENQRGAISGVSLDEEAANLIRFERAYQAAARVMSVTNDLMETVINLGRY
jgi:flagellar hook-associated protein 1